MALISWQTPSGGYRIGNNNDLNLNMGQSIGGLAYDAANNRLYTCSNVIRNVVCVFDDLPAPGVGPDKSTWPIIRPTSTILPRWWGVPRPGGPEAQYGWQERINDVEMINRSGIMKPYCTQRSYYNQWVEYEDLKIWSLVDDDHLLIAQGFAQGQGAGFMKRNGANPDWGCIGANTNAGISGMSCIPFAGAPARLMPIRWGGVQATAPASGIDLEATWNARHYMPMLSQPQGCGPTALSNGGNDLSSYAYTNHPRLSAGAPQTPTEQTLLDTCIARSITSPPTVYSDGSFTAYYNYVVGQGRTVHAALMAKWGIWLQKWGCGQANGGGLIYPGIGARCTVLEGRGPQNYQYQNSGFAPPGGYMWVSYALDFICLGMLHRFMPDGITLNPQPEFEVLPGVWRVDGMCWGPDGSNWLLNGMSWAETGSQTNPTVNIYLAA